MDLLQKTTITKNFYYKKLPETALFFSKFVSVSEQFQFDLMNWIELTRMFIFILFISVGVSFEGAFSLWLILIMLIWQIQLHYPQL